MSDLIGRDELIKDINANLEGVTHAVLANKIVKRQLAVDAVLVVRCKDCAYSEKSVYGRVAILCGVFCKTTWQDFFCAYGKPKDAEGGNEE